MNISLDDFKHLELAPFSSGEVLFNLIMSIKVDKNKMEWLRQLRKKDKLMVERKMNKNPILAVQFNEYRRVADADEYINERFRREFKI